MNVIRSKDWCVDNEKKYEKRGLESLQVSSLVGKVAVSYFLCN